MLNREFELDVLGQYYASINDVNQTGVFALSVYLKESIQPEILQKAADDMMRRLPFLNGRLKIGFFHYKYEVMEILAKIEPDLNEPIFGDYYNKGNRHMIKIFYGEKHFIVKGTHVICDGRGLSVFTKGLIARYYELSGVTFEKGDDIIDCSGQFSEEEAEDAAKRYAKKPPKGKTEETESKAKVYRTRLSTSLQPHTISKSFDAAKLKEKAKEHDVTIGEYILAHIFSVLAKRRGEETAGGEMGKIVASIPIDCRSFFPSRTLRSFATSAKVTMPELGDFSELTGEVRKEFKEITKDSVWAHVYEHERMYNMARFVPRAIKAWYMKRIAVSEAEETTTGLSNLGLIRLPTELEARIERIEFPIALEQRYAHFFSCATIGNALTLTAAFREEGRSIVEEVMELLQY